MIPGVWSPWRLGRQKRKSSRERERRKGKGGPREEPIRQERPTSDNREFLTNVKGIAYTTRRWHERRAEEKKEKKGKGRDNPRSALLYPILPLIAACHLTKVGTQEEKEGENCQKKGTVQFFFSRKRGRERGGPTGGRKPFKFNSSQLQEGGGVLRGGERRKINGPTSEFGRHSFPLFYLQLREEGRHNRKGGKGGLQGF